MILNPPRTFKSGRIVRYVDLADKIQIKMKKLKKGGLHRPSTKSNASSKPRTRRSVLNALRMLTPRTILRTPPVLLLLPLTLPDPDDSTLFPLLLNVLANELCSEPDSEIFPDNAKVREDDECGIIG